jgi:anti-sigma factor RsiW
MTACWSEGELRAYLDRELAPETLRQVALHLAECPECAGISAELEARAVFVSRAMQGLEAAPVRRAVHTRRWVAALALAAGLAIAALVIPKRAEQPLPVPEVARTAAAVEPPAPAQSVAPVPVREPVRRPVRRAAPASRSARALNDGFVRLDDEPFETGVVVRVALGPQQVPADVIFGSDGRARAIRLVNFK